MLLLVVLSPLLVLAALAVKLTSRGSILYRAERVGEGGKPFKMLKLRTMDMGADLCGPGITVQNDPRVTRVGRFLRDTKLDELPQFVNVLKGDMALVGPRPEAPRFVERYTAEQRRLLNAKPGVTGPAQLEYTLRHQEVLVDLEKAEDVYLSAMLEKKLRMDLEYIDTRSAVGDAWVLLRTAKVVGFSLARHLWPRRARPHASIPPLRSDSKRR